MQIFHTDLPNVMHEMIDDEVVIVNLDTGTYYSFDGVGGKIWEMLGNEGNSAESVSASLQAKFSGDAAQIAASTIAFLQQLQEEALVRVSDGEITDSKTAKADGERPPFTLPELQKYTDMEALLLADPIHEVDEGGWPNLK
jgi:hypothetical protein